jgi:hypothetical protein
LTPDAVSSISLAGVAPYPANQEMQSLLKELPRSGRNARSCWRADWIFLKKTAFLGGFGGLRRRLAQKQNSPESYHSPVSIL